MSYGTGQYGTGTYGVMATPLPMVVIPEPTGGSLTTDRPRMRIVLNTGDPDAVFATLSIRRDGQPLRAEVPLGVADPFVYDYEAPFGQLVTYTATGTYTPAGGGAPVDFSASATATLDESNAWLIHPTYPSLSVPLGRDGDDGVLVTNATATETTHTVPLAIFRPSGRRRAVVFPLGPRRDGEWSLVLFTHSFPARNAVMALLGDGAPLMLRSPAGRSWDLPDGWYSVGDVVPKRVGPVAREMSLPLTPVDSPPVNLAPATTWGDLVDAGLTWGDVLNDYGTWYDVLTGEPQ